MLIENIKDVMILISPLVLCFGASAICKIKKDSGSSVIFRPPGWTFGVVWTILFIMLGFSFLICTKKSQNEKENGLRTETDVKELVKGNVLDILSYVIYGGIILCLASWIVTYGCLNNKLVSMWLYILIFMFVFMGLCVGNTISKILLCPLIAWLIFAMFMSAQELHNSSKHKTEQN